jgi:hypothetical protein
VTDALPFVARTTVVPVGVSFVGWLFAKLSCVELSFATVLPFASLIVPVTTVVEVPLPVTVLGAAEHVMEAGEPKTVIDAEPVNPPAVATTLHGWDVELIDVAAKRPDVVTAPQPPVTVQLTLVPDGAPDAVNCWVPPTARVAEVGEMMSEPVAAGTVICQ